MKKILFILLVHINLTGLTSPIKDSLTNAKFHGNFQLFVQDEFNGFGTSVYHVKNKIIYGISISEFIDKKVNKLAGSGYNTMTGFYLLSGADIRLGKSVSVSLSGGPGYGYVERVENIRSVTKWFLVSYTTTEFDIVTYNVFSLKINTMLNLHLTNRISFQFGINGDFNRFYKSPYFAMGLKINSKG